MILGSIVLGQIHLSSLRNLEWLPWSVRSRSFLSCLGIILSAVGGVLMGGEYAQGPMRRAASLLDRFLAVPRNCFRDRQLLSQAHFVAFQIIGFASAIVTGLLSNVYFYKWIGLPTWPPATKLQMIVYAIQGPGVFLGIIGVGQSLALWFVIRRKLWRTHKVSRSSALIFLAIFALTFIFAVTLILSLFLLVVKLGLVMVISWTLAWLVAWLLRAILYVADSIIRGVGTATEILGYRDLPGQVGVLLFVMGSIVLLYAELALQGSDTVQGTAPSWP